MTIHKEGTASLFLTFGVLFVLNLALSRLIPDQVIIRQGFVVVSLILFLVVLQFFRHPKIKVTKDPSLVLAPADGKVVVIEETVEQEYLNEKRIQVSIFMSPINVHVNRNPVAGIISYFKYHPGKYLVAWHPKSSTENERTTLVYKLSSGVEILIRQVAGAMARRICWYVKPNQAVDQGAEFGFIKFGSRVDLYLPLGTEILVDKEQKTKAGVTPIARLKA
ncbi:phosphatidylserine decarboxylase family protein [Fulvivirgaceae bacterium LMO-SS25]